MLSRCASRVDERCVEFAQDASRGFHVGDAVKFFDAHVNFFDGVKEWSGLFLDAHQLGIRLNLMLTSNFDVRVNFFDADSAFVKMLSRVASCRVVSLATVADASRVASLRFASWLTLPGR